MELQWHKSGCPYLQSQLCQVQNLEETLELRLTEELPDVGRILCAWGQPVVRSKQWRSESMTVSGGVNASVLYLPEDGSSMRCVEVWIPYQAKWNLPASRREGAMRVSCLLSGLDARLLSNRKMMLRANLSLLGEALETAEVELVTPGAMPDGVEVLTNVYPAVLPREAGEKNFTIEEQIRLPGISKWVNMTLQPEVTEQTVVGSRVVLRGMGHLRYIGLDDVGQLHFGDTQIPFAQFAELDREYENGAMADVLLCVSGIEPEQTEDGVLIRCGITAQYLIKDRMMLEIAEDAYSPMVQLNIVTRPLKLPMELDCREELLDAMPPMMEGQLLHWSFLPEQSRVFREGEKLHLEIPGRFQILYRDNYGQLQAATQNWCGKLEYAAAGNTMLQPTIQRIEQSSTGVTLALRLQTWAEPILPMICDIEAGEVCRSQEGRPALLLHPMDADSLWELAKRTGSTMDAIRKANHLTQDPQQGQMLLIPIS